jgi:hypothetical protein
MGSEKSGAAFARGDKVRHQDSEPVDETIGEVVDLIKRHPGSDEPGAYLYRVRFPGPEGVGTETLTVPESELVHAGMRQVEDAPEGDVGDAR